MTAPTWHYGVTARWWAEFNTSGPEIDYFRRYAEDQPALDLACGTGRLLLPYLRDGLDVDGCDVSADMIALCREAAEREGLEPSLYVQPKHELDLPRRYRTVFMCGALGVGSTRAEDQEALRRVYDHLEPGGTFVLDNEVAVRGRLGLGVLAERRARDAASAAAAAGKAPPRLGRRRVRASRSRSSTSIRSSSGRPGRCRRSCGATASSSPRTSTC